MNFFKHLKSKSAGKAPESNNHANHPNTSPSPWGEGRGEGEQNNSGPQSAQTKNATPTNPIDSPDNRNGKIARLPREWRERINHALYRRCPAVRLAKALNKEPEVKAALAEHFQGRPISPQNLSEWKQGGYRDWLRQRQRLEQQRELTADAKDLADTANGMADSLFGMLTLDYARLMMNRDADAPEEFEKKRKAMSILAQDIVRLRRCHLNARRVQIQETRLENDQEKTDEQLFTKFVEWTENPAVRKACILAPMERDRRLRQHFDMAPTPEDLLVQKETQDDPYFGPSDENQTDIKPNPAKKTKPESSTTSVPPVSDPGANAPDISPISPICPIPPRDQSTHPSNGNNNSSTAPPSIADEGEQNSEPVNPYEGKTTQDVITEIEENCARKTAARLNARAPEKTSDAETQKDSELNTQNSALSKSPPSDYERACVEGKTHLEAMYAQFTPLKNPPPPREPIPCEPAYKYYAMSRVPEPLRPPPGFNSLG